MSDPSKYPPGTRNGGKSISPVNPSSAYGQKAEQPAASAMPPITQSVTRKPPVLAPTGAKPAGPPPAPLPGQLHAPPPGQFPPAPGFRPPGPGGPAHFPPKPAPPVPTPGASKGVWLIIGLAVGLPLCLLLACGVGGYLILSSAKKGLTTAANNAKNRVNQQQLDPNNPFAALDSPEVQKEFDKAFDKFDEEMKKQTNQKRGKTRPGGNSASSSGFPGGNSFPGEQEKDDYPTNLKRLQTGNDQEKQRAAEWFGRAPLETDKQDEVAKALNNLNTDSLRRHALPALKVWGTKENVPIIAKIMQQEAFVKIECMDILEKFKDERAIDPLISTLNEAFREGERAEEILADWWPQAEQPLIKHLHDKENRIRERTQRILELRKTDQSLLVAQTLEDLQSTNREVRQSAVAWLAKIDVQPDLQPKVAAAAQQLLNDSNNDSRRNALTMFGKYAQKEHADELLKLLDDREHEKWKAGLTGLLRLGDVRAAERIARRKEIRGEAFQMLRQAGAPAEGIAGKTITLIDVKDWIAGKDLCEILGDIGTSKSVGLLQQVKKAATGAKTPFVGEAADNAIESIRRRNGG